MPPEQHRCSDCLHMITCRWFQAALEALRGARTCNNPHCLVLHQFSEEGELWLQRALGLDCVHYRPQQGS